MKKEIFITFLTMITSYAMDLEGQVRYPACVRPAILIKCS